MKPARFAALAFAFALVLAFATPALAQTPSQDAYGGQAASQTVSQSGTLPFTGFALGVTVALALVLVGVGLAVRRSARSSNR